MRWKLLLIASLLATTVGAGAALGIVFSLFPSGERAAAPGLFALGALLAPVGAIAAASFFVYRHTARRRALQAMLTALFAGLLTLTIFLVSATLFSQPAPATPPVPPRNTG